MTIKEANHMFIVEYYNDYPSFNRAVGADYCGVQLEWECFMDNLCRDGILTQRQYNCATFPENAKRKVAR